MESLLQTMVLAGLVLFALAGTPLALFALWRTRELGALRRRLAILEQRSDAARAAPPGRTTPAPATSPAARREPSTPDSIPAEMRRATPPATPGAPAPASERPGEAAGDSIPAEMRREAPLATPGAPATATERPGEAVGDSIRAEIRGETPAASKWDAEVEATPPAGGPTSSEGRGPGRGGGVTAGSAGVESERAQAPAAPAIEWERWVGVRGAAVLGGLAAALAVIFFFQHAVAEGWIRFTPTLRVLTGFAFGGGLLVGGELLRRRDVRMVPEALSGAGIVAFYASLWAAQQMYGLISPLVGFAGMAGVTVLCGILSVRRSSMLIATLGLLGGFATPLLIDTDLADPKRLFLYLFLLNLGLLAVARNRRWAGIAALGFLGSFAYQLLWLLASELHPAPGLAVVVFGAFGVLFVLAPVGSAFERSLLGRGITTAGLIFPLVSSGLLQASFGDHFLPVAGLLVSISAAAAWVGARQGRETLPLAAALGSAAVLAAWAASASRGELGAWEVVGSGVALAIPGAILMELERRRGTLGLDVASLAARAAGPALLAALVVGLTRDQDSTFWPWATGFALLSALTYRAWGAAGRGFGPVLAAVLAGIGWRLFAVHTLVAAEFGPRDAGLHAGWILSAVAALAAVAWRWKPGEGARAAWVAVAAFCIVQLGMALSPRRLWVDAWELRGVLGFVLALPIAWIARRQSSAVLVGLGALAATWALGRMPVRVAGDGLHPAALCAAFSALSVGVFLVLPLAPARRAPGWLPAWVAAATPLLWTWDLERMVTAAFGQGWLGTPRLAAAACAALLAWRAAGAGADWRHVRRAASTAAVVFGAFGAAFAIGHAPLLVAVALVGVGLAALWRHEALFGWKLGACAALALAALGTVVPLVVPGWVEHQPRAVFNALGYAHGVVLAALGVSAWLFAAVEEDRRLELEQRLPLRRPAFALTAAAAIAAGFASLNVLILDAFATTREIGYASPHAEGRDLALSIGWAVYALVLLGLGMARSAAAPRWASLALMVATLGKVFLVDLGELEGLHRVGSLLGLAAALLVVSLLYQRFVFRRPAGVRESGEAGARTAAPGSADAGQKSTGAHEENA